MTIPALALKRYVPGVPMMTVKYFEHDGVGYEPGDIVPVDSLAISAHRINTLMEMRIFKHTDEKCVVLQEFTGGGKQFNRGDIISEDDLKMTLDQQLNLLRARVLRYAPEEMLKALKAPKKTTTKKKAPKPKADE